MCKVNSGFGFGFFLGICETDQSLSCAALGLSWQAMLLLRLLFELTVDTMKLIVSLT